MAELIRTETGRVGVGGAPSAATPNVVFPQITPEIALVAQAKYQGTVAQKLDRMSALIFREGEQISARAGLQFAAENPLTKEQLEAMAKGDMSTVSLGSPINVFDSAVRKVRAFELSAHAEVEASTQLLDIYKKAESGELDFEAVRSKVKSLTDGIGSALAQVDPESSFKYRASVATMGNKVIDETAKLEGKRRIAANAYKLNILKDNTLKMIELVMSGDDPIDPTNNLPIPKDYRINKFFESFAQSANSLVGVQGATAATTEMIKNITDTKANVMAQYFLSDEFGQNITEKLGKLKANNGGKFTEMWEIAPLPFRNQVFDQMKSYSDNIKKGIDAEFTQAELNALPIIREIMTTADPGRSNELFGKLKNMPIDPAKLRSIKEFIISDAAGASTDDTMTLYTLTSKSARGQLTVEELLKNRGKLTKGTIKALAMDIAKPNDDIEYGEKQINLAVGIQQANLPPELPTAEARSAAVMARNKAAMDLRLFAATPNDKGVFPTAAEIRAKGSELSKGLSKDMAPIFTRMSNTNQNTAVMLVPELTGVDLNNVAATEQALKTASANPKRKPQDIAAAKNAINEYRANQQKAKAGE
jgi:hypothetical protein